MNVDKEFGRDLCKSHSARLEKEFCRVCPSKLNKKELEDVYFSLLESNLDLKKTINTQRDKIKVLSTKIQRLTAVQKTYLGSESKCCGGKAVINEQKECISELRRSNQCLSERVRQLNMRLCSAKQFMKRSPFQATSRCNRCSNKNASMSALITKRSDSNLRTVVASSQYLLEKDIVSSRTADNDVISHEKGVQYDFCIENKCRTTIEELKEKNEDLQQQLLKISEEHAIRISEYEKHLSDVRAEKLRMRSDLTLSEDRLVQLKEESTELTRRLGVAEIHCDELSVELSIKKRKVSEMEMRVKAAEMSSRIASAIEAHLTNIKSRQDQDNEIVQHTSGIGTPTADESPRLIVPSPRNIPKAAVRTKIPHLVEEVFKNSDDSGYTEINRSHEIDEHKASTYINQVLMEKIADLQNQINNLKVSKVQNESKSNIQSMETILNTNIATNQNNILKSNERQTKPFTFEEYIISESSDSIISEKKNTTSVVENKDEKQENEGIIQAIHSQTEKRNDASGLKRLTPVNTTSSEEIPENKLNRNEHIETTKRETFKQFKKRSKDKAQIITENRKYSLESSRENKVKRKLIKTGSLDEQRITDVDSTEEMKRKHKIFKETGNILKSDTTDQAIGLKDDIVSNINEPRKSKEFKSDNIEVNSKYKSADTVKTEVNLNAHVVNATTDINVRTLNKTAEKCESDSNKGSNSSKGTYSIHRDDGIVKISTDNINSPNRIKDDRKPEERVSNKEGTLNILLADVKRNVLNSVLPKDKLGLEKRRSSSPSQPRTYLIPPKQNKLRETPDSTECEMSSFSDLPLERDDDKRKYRSPGEERTTTSESRPDTATTDYGSLSEGELPLPRESTILSAGETRVPNKTPKSHSLPVSRSRQMEEALSAVRQELSRCTTLLRGQPRRSLDGVQAK